MVKYLYDGIEPALERNTAGSILAVYTRILQVPGGIGGLISLQSTVNGQPLTVYYHCSHLGNVNQITNSITSEVEECAGPKLLIPSQN